MISVKKIFAFVGLLSFASGISVAHGAGFTEKPLGSGKVRVYDFGDIKLHAYNTADVMSDENFLVETKNSLIGIEGPAFFNDAASWKSYIDGLNKPVKAFIVVAHPAKSDWNAGAQVYSTAGAAEAIRNGAVKALVENLSKAFGKEFITESVEIKNILKQGQNVIEGVKFNITEAGDAFDVEIPQINAVYTHMLGGDRHSILASDEHIAAVLKTLEGYKKKKYALLLSGHHEPESIAAVDDKIAYVKKVRELSWTAKTADEFKDAMKKAFPKYGDLNYLDMTAGFLFAK